MTVDGDRKASASLGLALLTFGLFALAGPGRIDMIDGQVRYEAANRWLESGSPALLDPALTRPGGKRPQHTGYGVGAILTGLPFVGLVPAEADPQEEVRRFAFVLSSAAGGGLAIGALLLLLLELGVSFRAAVGWSLLGAFGTLLFPVAASSFTHAQTAALVTASVACALASSRTGQLRFAAMGGVFSGLLVPFDDYLILLIPSLALATLSLPPSSVVGWLRGTLRTVLHRPSGDRASFRRFWTFILGLAPGLAIAGWWNWLRFGHPLQSRDMDNLPAAHPLFGNALEGLLSLLASPGKGILFFSPLVILTLAGLPALWRRRPELAAAVVASTATLFLLLSPLAFFGGDWCWGPRYLVVLVPLWCAPWPLAESLLKRKRLMTFLVSVSVSVQVIGLSLDHHRFFYERALQDYFWAHEPWFYFRNSQLFARPAEVAQSWKERELPRGQFLPNPYGLKTYAPFGTPPQARALSPKWVTGFSGFYLPRPWPLWMSALPPEDRPVPLGMLLVVFSTLSLVGGALLFRSARDTTA